MTVQLKISDPLIRYSNRAAPISSANADELFKGPWRAYLVEYFLKKSLTEYPNVDEKGDKSVFSAVLDSLSKYCMAKNALTRVKVYGISYFWKSVF